MRPASPNRRRRALDIVQQPWRQFVNPFAPVKLISDDEVESLHLAALKILEDIGIRCVVPEALDLMQKAGAIVDRSTAMFRIGRDVVEEALKTVPSEITLTPRNPARAVKTGGRYFTTACVYGPPNSSNLVRGRRPGNLADLAELLKLSQFYNVMQVNGWPLEPLDVEVRFRHLDVAHLMLTLTDKVPCILCQGRKRVEDALTLCAMARGETLEQFAARPGAVSIINTNTPLQYDVPMAHGVMDMARHGQVTFISPFVMAGASTPATMASSMAMTAAEVLCGVVLAQFTRRGAPVVFGDVAIPTDMRTGAPAYGMPDGFRAYLIGGQLARRYKMPSRMSNFSCSAVPDFASGFESAGSQYAMLMAGANVWMHLTGWVEGGLCTSYEKFVMDCELAQGLVHLMQPVEVSADALALDEIARVGPGGHFFGEARTLETVESAFYRPMVSITQNYGAWMEAGGKTAEQRATGIWQEALAQYQQPPLDEAVAGQMAEFVTRRKAEGGAAID